MNTGTWNLASSRFGILCKDLPNQQAVNLLQFCPVLYSLATGME
jgi:hypothetical protein